MNLNRVAIILRGVSGSSKSTFALYVKRIYEYQYYQSEGRYDNERCVVCTADDYFTKDGVYTFRAEGLGMAHKQCQDKFTEALNAGAELVCVANTSTTERELEFYVDKAREMGYIYFVMVMENRHGNQNSHGVPLETIDKQELRLKNSLKLR